MRLRNIQARPPLVRHREDKLWELREESSTNSYRLLYSFFIFFTGRRTIILHGFQEKTQRTPRRSAARLVRFVAQEEFEKGTTDE